MPIPTSQTTSQNRSPKILFLTSSTPDRSSPWIQDYTPLTALKSRGISVSMRSFRSPSLKASDLSTYTHILFLSCYDYHLHPEEFRAFITDSIQPAQALNPALKVLNPPSIILWNHDKTYLRDLSAAGILVPETEYIPIDNNNNNLPKTIQTALRHRPTPHPVVVKPSISASSYLTRLIHDPHNLTAADLAYLTKVSTTLKHGAVLIQPLIPEIRSSGEISLCLIGGELMHAVRKTTAGNSPANVESEAARSAVGGSLDGNGTGADVGGDQDFRTGPDFGGEDLFVALRDVPAVAVDTARKVWEFVEGKARAEGDGELAYLRVDGVVTATGFVVLEAEGIEPYMWMETGTEGEPGLERFIEMVLGEENRREGREPSR